MEQGWRWEQQQEQEQKHKQAKIPSFGFVGVGSQRSSKLNYVNGRRRCSAVVLQYAKWPVTLL